MPDALTVSRGLNRPPISQSHPHEGDNVMETLLPGNQPSRLRKLWAAVPPLRKTVEEMGRPRGPRDPNRDVRCPQIWAGYGDLTAHCRLPFGDLAAEPYSAGEGRCGSPADRRRHRRGLRRRVAARGVGAALCSRFDLISAS
jgi:hypothetical protein